MPPSTNPDSITDPAHLASLAASLHREGKHLAAVELYDRLIREGTATAAIWCGAGTALNRLGERAQAARAFERALDLQRDYPEAQQGLAQARFALGETDAAAALLLDLAERTNAFESWLGLATILPGCTSADDALIRRVRSRFATELARRHPTTSPGAHPRVEPPRPGEPLRIGYLSAFFHRANYMKPVWGLINHHDRVQIQLHLFSDSPANASWPGYRAHPSDRAHHVESLGNNALAALIRESGIHILVDLNGYSVSERLALFLERSAPVTVAWFNMYATSGLPGFDYIVGDDAVVLAGEERQYTERVSRLPCSYLTFEPDDAAPPLAPPPCLSRGYLTFGSLIAQYKITPATLDAWAQILRRAPASRFVLGNAALGSTENRNYVVEQFARRGISAERLTLRGPAEHHAFLQYYDQMDIALDATPYNGGTTTMEALWQGVPVLTSAGPRWSARTSQSILRGAHLAHFVADSVPAFVARAVAWANDPATPQHLATLRQSMREQLAASSACNAASLARHMETFYASIARHQ